MTEPIPRAELTDVPVFPLPNVAFFPRTALPLHIFEPRYRAMMAVCLESPRRLMVVAQLRPGFERDYEGRPPIYEVAGLGRVERFHHQPDGTYDLTLEGLSRVRLAELPADDTLFRRAELWPLRERMPPRGLEPAQLASLLSLASRVSTQLRAAQPGFELSLPTEREPGTLTDRIADQLLIDPAARQEALEILDIGQRMRFVMDQLSRLHMALGGQEGPRTLH